MNDGHAVAGIDGTENRAAPRAILGRRDGRNARGLSRRCADVRTLYESLDDRVMAGFGGVAEYGITVRWTRIS